MNTFLETFIKLALFSPAIQRMASQNIGKYNKPFFNMNLPAQLGGSGKTYSGGIRPSNILSKNINPQTPNMNRFL